MIDEGEKRSKEARLKQVAELHVMYLLVGTLRLSLSLLSLY